MTNRKGSTGGAMGMSSIKPAHLQKKKNNFSYKSHLNGPVKVIKADGTFTIEAPMTGQEIAAVIKKSKLK